MEKNNNSAAADRNPLEGENINELPREKQYRFRSGLVCRQAELVWKEGLALAKLVLSVPAEGSKEAKLTTIKEIVELIKTKDVLPKFLCIILKPVDLNRAQFTADEPAWETLTLRELNEVLDDFFTFNPLASLLSKIISVGAAGTKMTGR